jgi:membrane fusion protein (multidrug efflux system)
MSSVKAKIQTLVREPGLVQAILNTGHMRRSLPRYDRLICALVSSILILFAGGCKKKVAPPPARPEVEVVTVTPASEPIFEEWIGTLDGAVNAQIRAQVSGYLLTQNYTEGSEVRKGALLFQIDPRPFQATLDQAKAKKAQDEAQLTNAKITLARNTDLLAKKVIDQSDFDTSKYQTDQFQAAVLADQAAIESAQLNLNFTKITSPIDGLAGIATAQIGDLVGPSSTALTTVSTIDPIKVDFEVSEESDPTLWRAPTAGSEAAERPLELQLILPDGSVYPEKGKVDFADRAVNSSTGTLEIVGLFPNPKRVLRPGQYARVRAQTGRIPNALLVPQRAVTEFQGGYQVAVVDSTNRVHIQSVTTGDQIGSNWIIASGLKPGDRVVVEGLQKVKEGTVVNPKPFTEQAARPAPKSP